MGNKLSCSCGPVKIKGGYRYDTKEPWGSHNTSAVMGNGRSAVAADDPRHVISLPICRLWAEVFHVTTSSSGTVKWTQVSEDLVPVNISCTQDSTGMKFCITAYNSQVEKILDVTLTHPGNETTTTLTSP